MSKKDRKIKTLKKQIKNLENTLDYQGRSVDAAWEYSSNQTEAIRNLFEAIRLISEASKYQL